MVRDIYAREYTELRNAPHFIFNGKHTRDFNVSNVQVESGLAKDTFLANRSLIVERTRYHDKSYLLGYSEEPLKFRVRLLFDEHKFNHANISALRRWLHTETFHEFKFDNEEESALHIIMYAMVTGSSELSHNVIDDGYVDIEFTTNSSRKYSEIMVDNYDFSLDAIEKVVEMYRKQFGALVRIENKLGKTLKQYVARTSYTNIEGFFTDKDDDKIPDGWELIDGKTSDMSVDDEGKLFLNNVRLRRTLNLNNNKEYYLRMDALNGKIRVHEEDFDVNTLGLHHFKYRRNLLGDKGTFDLDTNKDNIAEGWNKVNPNPNLIKAGLAPANYVRPNSAGAGVVTEENGWIKVVADAGRDPSIYVQVVGGNITKALEVGKKYTFSATVKIPPNTRTTYYVGNSEATSKTFPQSTVEQTGYVEMTFTKTESAQYPVIISGSGTTLLMKDLKLEESPVATYAGTFALNKDIEYQGISNFGQLSTSVALMKDNFYLLAFNATLFKSNIKLDGIEHINDKREKLVYIPFKYTGTSNNLVIKSMLQDTANYQYMRIYNITEDEFKALKARKDNSDNIIVTNDYAKSSTSQYQTVENTHEKFKDTGQDIWKVTKILGTAAPPTYIQAERILVKPNESVTASLWYRQDDKNTGNISASLLFYNGLESKVESQVSLSTKQTKWERVAVTYTNYSGVNKEINPYFYVAREAGNITYFTSPQLEFSKTVSDYKEPALDYINREYPHFDSRPYFELDYRGAEGYIESIDLYELNPLHKKRIDEGTPLDEVVGVNYESYNRLINEYKTQLDKEYRDLEKSIEEGVDEVGHVFNTPYHMSQELGEKIAELKKMMTRPNNPKAFYWEETQKIMNKLQEINDFIEEMATEYARVVEENKDRINSSTLGADIVEVFNFGDKPVYPTFEFECMDDSDITIENLETGEKTTITDNQAGEKITMIGSSEMIKTSRKSPYFKYDHHDDVFIRLRVGHNTLRFAGSTKLRITYQFIIL